MRSFSLFAVLLSFFSCSLFGQESFQPLRQSLTASSAIAIPANPMQNKPEKKSVFKAVLYSLLVPGMGEWYADRFSSGQYSMIAEGTLWITYAGFQQYGTWIQNDAREYARIHAGAAGSQPDQYYVDLGNFNSIDEFNQKKLRDRTDDKLYDPSAGLSWNWTAESDRQRYRSLRVSSDQVFNNSRFVLGAIIVNHIASAVNAALMTAGYNKEISNPLGSWNLGVSENVLSGLAVTVSKTF